MKRSVANIAALMLLVGSSSVALAETTSVALGTIDTSVAERSSVSSVRLASPPRLVEAPTQDAQPANQMDRQKGSTRQQTATERLQLESEGLYPNDPSNPFHEGSN